MSKDSLKKEFNNRFINWIDTRLPVFSMLVREYGEFPMPRNVNYLWSFGAIASVILLIMIFSGIFLAMHYKPDTELAFNSVERIMRDVNWGWFIRYLHANGASMLFIAIYIHMFRGMYYGSYKNPREILWIIGVIIYLVMIITAFLGYVLPWGQMSFWAATVITNLLSAIPYIGETIVTWLWGGFSVDDATLNRFYALHFLLPFVLLLLVVLHVWALHVSGSNNPTGIEVSRKSETVNFYPYIFAKDLVAIVAFAIFYSVFVFYLPDMLGHTDNYIKANPLSTPEHIVPEWYFLPFYAILRAVPAIFFVSAKFAGTIALFASILILAVLPWLDSHKTKSARYRPYFRLSLILFAINFILLGYLGSKPAEGVYIYLARFSTFWYFFHFLIILPVLSRYEKGLKLPNSLSLAITKK